MTTTARRAIATFTAVVALVVGAATPASATPWVGTVTTGSITITTVNPVASYSFDIDGAAPVGAPCPEDTSDPTLTVDFDGVGGTLITAASFPKTQVEVPEASGNWFYLNLSLAPTGSRSGAITGGTLTQNVTLRGALYKTAPPVSCTKGAAVCTLQVALVLSGPWSGGPTPPGTATLATSGPANITRAGACQAPFATRFPATAPFATASASGLTIAF